MCLGRREEGRERGGKGGRFCRCSVKNQNHKEKEKMIADFQIFFSCGFSYLLSDTRLPFVGVRDLW